MRMGEVRTAIALAHRADPIAASLGSPVASATAESMLGIALHWAGEHESARRSLECLLQELTRTTAASPPGPASVLVRTVLSYWR